MSKFDQYSAVPYVYVSSINIAAGATAADYDGMWFIADRAYKLVEARERHQTVGSDTGAVTLMIKKVPSGTAKASGTDMLASGGLNLKATADTNVLATLHATVANTRLATGDSIALVSTGTLTAVDGVSLTLVLRAD